MWFPRRGTLFHTISVNKLTVTSTCAYAIANIGTGPFIWHYTREDVSSTHTETSQLKTTAVETVYPNVTSKCSVTHAPGPESASELYRPGDRRLSAKLVPTFADRGVSRGQRGTSVRP
jgi:hypothetical protein